MLGTKGRRQPWRTPSISEMVEAVSEQTPLVKPLPSTI